jgi:hypothetical protein
MALRKKSSGSGRRGVVARLAGATYSSLPFVCAPAKTCYAWRVVRQRSIAWSALVAAALFADTLTGCGRHATQVDCQLIVDKSVELELRETNQTSPDAIEKREEQVRGELQDEIKSCEGRHVTDRTMACVHAATTTQELDACLR